MKFEILLSDHYVTLSLASVLSSSMESTPRAKRSQMHAPHCRLDRSKCLFGVSRALVRALVARIETRRARAAPDRRRSNKNATGNDGHYARDRYTRTTTASKDVISDVV